MSGLFESAALLAIALTAGLLAIDALGVAGLGTGVAEIAENLPEQLAQLVLELRMREDVKAILAHRLEHARGDHIRLHAKLVHLREPLHELAVHRLGAGLQSFRSNVITRVDVGLDQPGAQYRHTDAMR